MKRNIWPYAIMGYFVVFITGMVTWITFAMRHDDQLVRPDYYEHELKYQNQIEQVARTGALAPDARVAYDSVQQAIRLELPRTHGVACEGIVHLYRPSDARLDQKLRVAVDANGGQQIDASKLQGGLWKVFVSWRALEKDFYLEQAVIVDRR